MNKQELSIEQMKRLKELGVNTSNITITLQDIFDLLPGTIETDYFGVVSVYWLELGVYKKDKSGWFILYRSEEGHIYNEIKENELIDTAYEMLCWCIENGYMETYKED